MRPIIHCQLINDPFGDPGMYADIMFESRALLFDMGDVAGMASRKLLRVGHVFVSHAHMDHFAGFDHLLRLLLGRAKTVALYGPANFIDQVEHKLKAYTWNVIRNYTADLLFQVTEVAEGGALRNACFRSSLAFQREDLPETRMNGDGLASCGGLQVRCAILDHATPCLGFAVEEPAHVNVWKDRLDDLGLSVGPWLRDLKQAVLMQLQADTPITVLRRGDTGGASATLPLHALRDVVQVTKGQKIAYVVDVRYNPLNAERIRRLAFGADLLFIECAFLQVDAEQAARKNHLTAWQAGTLARQSDVKRLIPFHFSTRYRGRGEDLCAEADRAFRETSGSGELP
ncbi:MAG TPA: MBL fold metallo-hydrolase [Rhodopila sp.]|nr:MBL fold metallo-hydrolase [Rhodopila sp.]